MKKINCAKIINWRRKVFFIGHVTRFFFFFFCILTSKIQYFKMAKINVLTRGTIWWSQCSILSGLQKINLTPWEIEWWSKSNEAMTSKSKHVIWRVLKGEMHHMLKHFHSEFDDLIISTQCLFFITILVLIALSALKSLKRRQIITWKSYLMTTKNIK